MSQQVACEIEFIGGPVDGHAELMVLPLQPFLGVRTVSTPDANLFFFTMLRRLLRRYRSETIPLALYELTEGHGRPCYRYLGTQAIREQQLRQGALNAVIQSLKHINL